MQACDESLLTSLCHDVMTLVAAEAGGEVARMFEYQLALLLGNVDAASVTLFAEHCAQRALDYAVKVALLSVSLFCTCGARDMCWMVTLFWSGQWSSWISWTGN